ncbi:porin [Aureimonas mangrovi]|uniref:porin n=1 Tax=Aureimonas mangrovi TaxID=2758041 RepID=UPI001FE9C7D3|nr:porin [Aureimonas mangrovi]
MNIKSLLLGSAAALVAVSGARAADVIMVEPEPVEYVRVCDIYGSGFYYIPGTETCLQISGYVRYEYRYESEGSDREVEFDGGVADVLSSTNLDGDDYRFRTRTRGRLNFDARQETEWGTLRAYYRLQAQRQDDSPSSAGSNASVEMDRGFLQLGGLTAGYLNTLWVSELAGGGLTADAGTGLDASFLPYGDAKANQLNYTFALNGFNASIGLEQDGTGDFAPDILAKLSYAGGFGAAWVIGAYDERVNADSGFAVPGYPPFDDVFGDEDEDDGAFAIKAGIALQDLFVADSQLKIQGNYSFDPSAYSYRPNAGAFTYIDYDTTTGDGTFIRQGNAGIPLEWAVEAGYTQAFGAIDAGIGGIYGRSFEILGSGEEVDYFGIEGNLVYNFTDRFFAGLFVTYENFDDNGLTDEVTGLNFNDDEFRGLLRIQRSF